MIYNQSDTDRISFLFASNDSQSFRTDHMGFIFEPNDLQSFRKAGPRSAIGRAPDS